nr:laccase-11 [Quercus suber]
MGAMAMKIYNGYAFAVLFAIVVFGSFIANSATTGTMDMSTAILLKVDQSGNGDFKKIQDAIDAVPSNNSELYFILVKPGTYREKLQVPADKPFITLSGTLASNTIITWGDTGEIIQSATLSVFGSDFVARSLTIQNTFGTSGKAVALRVEGDRVAFYGCKILSYQDTLLDDAGRHYYSNCYIEGATDFICGNAASLFERCHLHSLSTVDGAITAQHRNSPSEDTGFSFLGCKITGVGTALLGRPWGPYSRVVFALTYMSSVVVPQGWDDWGDQSKQRAVALRVEGDTAAFYNCNILSYQDTLLDDTGRHYYSNCYIEGATDFICGNAASLFEKCHLHSLSTVGGAITAQHRNSSSEDTGYTFLNCKITGVGTALLGRPWGPYSRVVFALTYMFSVVVPQGWDDWGDPSKQSTVYYGEYQCYGPGANRTKRVGWSKSLSNQEATPFLTKDMIGGQAEAAVKKYQFDIQVRNVSRLCHAKPIVTVNGMFPGPTIYVREGDRVLVNVTNSAQYNMSIHWHGLKQYRNGWADGPAYITQCPIKTGNSYVYDFNVTGQRGTLWWHAHIFWLRATVYGAVVIMPKQGTPFPFPQSEREENILLGEWWNNDVEALVKQGNRLGLPPNMSDAHTINGKPGPLFPCSDKHTFAMEVEQGKTYLLRIINAALNDELFFAIAGHNLTVVEVDAVYTKPFTTQAILITPGQTTNVLVQASQVPSRYFMAARPFMDAPLSIDNKTATAILQYKGIPNTVLPILPQLPAPNDTTFALSYN